MGVYPARVGQGAGCDRCRAGAPPSAAGPVPGTGHQRWDWRDTGILPASAGEPPPEDPGLVKVSVPEARRLLRLVTTPMTAAARQSGHAWSRWRRRHQARAPSTGPGSGPPRHEP